MDDCAFCKIISGEFDSAKIYEDNDVVAFLDIQPLTRGHALVIPKQHFQDIHDVSNYALQKVAAATQKISQKVKDVLEPVGIRISQSNGEYAGQVIFHYHVHIIPRYYDDGWEKKLDNPLGTTHGADRSPKPDMSELKKLAEQLKI